MYEGRADTPITLDCANNFTKPQQTMQTISSSRRRCALHGCRESHAARVRGGTWGRALGLSWEFGLVSGRHGSVTVWQRFGVGRGSVLVLHGI